MGKSSIIFANYVKLSITHTLHWTTWINDVRYQTDTLGCCTSSTWWIHIEYLNKMNSTTGTYQEQNALKMQQKHTRTARLMGSNHIKSWIINMFLFHPIPIQSSRPTLVQSILVPPQAGPPGLATRRRFPGTSRTFPRAMRWAWCESLVDGFHLAHIWYIWYIYIYVNIYIYIIYIYICINIYIYI